MGKAAMCIRMLQVLNTGRVYKISELADILNTNPRNIIEYKKELDEVATECGYEFYIETIPGRYGGYRISGEGIIPSLRLNAGEKESLVESLNYLYARNDFPKKKEYLEAMSKIMSSLVIKDIKDDSNMTVINRFPLSMSEEEIKYRYDIIKSAIKNKKKIIINYISQKNVAKDYEFDPYEVFMYNNAYFMIGWMSSSDNPDIRWFKLNRIQKITLTDKKFSVWKFYNRNNYLDEFGFKSNGDWYHVEFIAYGTYAALTTERIYGKNQIVERIDQNSTKVSVDMQNQESIRVFVLGFGKNIKVLEPQWLKDDLKDIANHLLEMY